MEEISPLGTLLLTSSRCCIFLRFASVINISFFPPFPFKHKLITFNSFDVSFSSRDESKDTGSSAGTRPFGEPFVAHYRFISVHEAHHDAPRRKMKDSHNFGRC